MLFTQTSSFSPLLFCYQTIQFQKILYSKYLSQAFQPTEYISLKRSLNKKCKFYYWVIKCVLSFIDRPMFIILYFYFVHKHMEIHKSWLVLSMVANFPHLAQKPGVEGSLVWATCILWKINLGGGYLYCYTQYNTLCSQFFSNNSVCMFLN